MESKKLKDTIEILENEIKNLNDRIFKSEKQNQEELQLLLSSIIEIPDDTIIYAVDKNLNFLAFNKKYKDYIKNQTNVEVSTGQNILEIYSDKNESMNLEKLLKRALTGENFFQIGDDLKNSKRYYYKDVYKPLINNSNEVIGVIVNYTNITESTRSEKTWRILIDIYENIHKAENIEELIGFVHNQLSYVIDTTNFYVALYDEKNDVYSFPYYIDKFDEISKIEPKSLKKSLTDYVRRRGLPLLLTDYFDKALIDSGEIELIGTPSPSWLGVPLKTGDKSIGVLVIQNYGEKGVFTEKDLELMAFVSEHIAMALERKRFEQELQKNSIDLRIAKNKAEESDRLKSAFLANMSHEIRTPLNAIMGFSKLLAKHELSLKQRQEYYQYIENSGNNLLNLINDIIDVAKIEAGQILIRKTICKINYILDELFTTFSKHKITKDKDHIDLILSKANNNPDFTIVIDAHRFRQILANLIGNSFKFIEKGAVEFGYIYKDENTLIFYVKDTGIGIPDDKSDIIFSRFGQIVGSEIRNPGGTGLGLSITKHLIEEMGGEIWFESKIGKGTTFFFTIPVMSEPDENAEENLTDEKSETYDLSATKILVVEDDIINTTLLTDTLRLHNPKINIDTAADGEEAIIKIKNNNYDVVIMDIRMPNMDGYQATNHIRTMLEEPKRSIPIIGLSAHAMKEEKDKSLAAGMNVFLTKPIVEKDIIKQISLLTGAKKIETQENSEKSSEKTGKEKEYIYKHINLSLLKEMYRNDKTKINNILNLCLQNIPKQIKDIEVYYNTEKWDQLRITSHTMKSTFNYIGLNELRTIAKTIEDYSSTKTNILEIPELISQIKSIWSLAFDEVEYALHNQI